MTDYAKLIPLGVMLILLGFALIFFGILMQGKVKGETKVAVAGFLGPIPFGFGNDKKLVTGLLVVLFVLLIIFWMLKYFRVQ